MYMAYSKGQGYHTRDGGGCDCQGVAWRGFCHDKTVLYLGCDGSYKTTCVKSHRTVYTFLVYVINISIWYMLIS